jgi:hypothetical protein
MHVFRSVPTWLCGSLVLCGLTLACGPALAPAPTPASAVADDPFAVVRATSQAAYQTGQTFLDQGDIVRGCPAIDTAKTTDPDNNPAIQAALNQCLTAITEAVALAATPEPTPQQRTIVVATVPAAPPAAAGSTTTPAGPGNAAGAGAPQSQANRTPAGNNQAPATGGVGPPANQVMYHDPQGRFLLGAPADWQSVPEPLPLFGSGVVQFRDPSGRAELEVAVDSTTRAVSPELYAASMEIAMQQQVPGYALEQVQPSSTAGQPSIRRVFTFTQRDATGRDLQARSFQVVVLKGSTPYIISGSTPADQLQQYSASFDQMVESFGFS